MRQDLAQTVASEIGDQALPCKIDLTVEAERPQMLAATLARSGRCDVLINNADIQRVALPFDVTVEHWNAVMNVNAKPLEVDTLSVCGA